MGVGAQRRLQVDKVQQAIAAGLQPGNLEAVCLQRTKYVCDGLVLGLHCDEMFTAMRALPGDTLYREVV